MRSMVWIDIPVRTFTHKSDPWLRDTLFVLTQVDGEGRSQLVVGDLSRDPPAFAAPVDVDLSCCPWGVGALGATPL